MDYKSLLSGQIRFWHMAVPADQIEEVFARKADVRHSIGEKRGRHTKSVFKDSYCSFRVVPTQKTSSEFIVSECLTLVERHWDDIQILLSSGGWMNVYIVVYDVEVVQLDVGADKIARLAQVHAGLVVDFANS